MASDSVAGAMTGPPRDAEGRLEVDILCLKCGYNLRGRVPSEGCAECGEPSEKSLAAWIDPGELEAVVPRLRWALALMGLTPLFVVLVNRLQWGFGWLVFLIPAVYFDVAVRPRLKKAIFSGAGRLARQLRGVTRWMWWYLIMSLVSMTPSLVIRWGVGENAAYEVDRAFDSALEPFLRHTLSTASMETFPLGMLFWSLSNVIASLLWNARNLCAWPVLWIGRALLLFAIVMAVIRCHWAMPYPPQWLPAIFKTVWEQIESFKYYPPQYALIRNAISYGWGGVWLMMLLVFPLYARRIRGTVEPESKKREGPPRL